MKIPFIPSRVLAGMRARVLAQIYFIIHVYFCLRHGDRKVINLDAFQCRLADILGILVAAHAQLFLLLFCAFPTVFTSVPAIDNRVLQVFFRCAPGISIFRNFENSDLSIVTNSRAFGLSNNCTYVCA